MKTSFLQNAARIALGAAMILAGVGHLTFQRREFRAQVPRWLPTDPGFQDFVVLSSGVVEVAMGLATILLVKRKREMGITLAVFYVLVFPGNLSQYTYRVDGLGLDTDQKRFVRLFFQPMLIAWALWASGALDDIRTKRKLIG
jgi:uncharacterized membrane protein